MILLVRHWRHLGPRDRALLHLSLSELAAAGEAVVATAAPLEPGEADLEAVEVEEAHASLESAGVEVEHLRVLSPRGGRPRDLLAPGGGVRPGARVARGDRLSLSLRAPADGPRRLALLIVGRAVRSGRPGG